MAVCVCTPNFLWRVENFTSIHAKTSPTILIGGLKWQVKFSRFLGDGDQKVILILVCESELEQSPIWQFSTEVSAVCSRTGARYRTDISKYTFKNKEEWCIWCSSLSQIYSSVGQIKDIIFSIVISPIGNLENLFKSQTCVDGVIPVSLCVKSLVDDFRKLFNNEENSDFVLKCEEKSFYVHKSVLSARSSFFAGMFRCNMKESKENVGKIENLESNILEIILRYIYTGELPKLSMKCVQKVYAAADRFDVEPLKIKCYSLFIENFINSPEKVSENKTNEESSNKVETETITTEEKKFLKDLFVSNQWRSFSQEFPHKAQEMCRPYLLQI